MLTLKNHSFAEEYRAGRKSYSCGSSYCDRLGVVARLAANPVDVSDTPGTVKRLPVLEIEELVDRCGTYRPK